MKDREDKPLIMTSEPGGQDTIAEDEEGRGRSRGRRRTAKEIAQMFEQLKQRHITRKKEWQAEKEELVRQAALAEESKRILVDLKKILVELRIELRNEEKKRMDAQDDHDNMRDLWIAEKEELLKIIKNLENHFCHDAQHSNTSKQEEIEALRSQMSLQQRQLAVVSKTTSELQKKMKEQQVAFDEEKRQIVECHDGERRNWDKTKQVMLEKIEQLQDENRQSASFPLHGSHVASIATDEVYLTSPLSDERSSMSDERCTRQNKLANRETGNSSFSASREPQIDETSTKYNNFQKTVDEALKQIEKISLDLNTIDVEGVQTSTKAGKLSSPRTKTLKVTNSNSTCSTNQDRDKVSPALNKSSPQPNAISRKVSASSYEGSDVPSCSRQSDLRNSSSGNTPERVRSNSFKFTKAQSKLPLRRCSLIHSSDVDTGVSSPSTNVPPFTESGNDSTNVKSKLASNQNKKSGVTKTFGLIHQSSEERHSENSPTNFTKAEKRYADPKQPNKGATTAKKLPNLHQKLLFRNLEKAEINQEISILPDTESGTYGDQQHTHYFDPEKGYVKKSPQMVPSPRLSHRNADCGSADSGNEDKLGVSKNLPENRIEVPNSNDFVEQPAILISNETCIGLNEDEPPPPVHPKPSVTIEKDASGNVLRVITDPRFQRQGSPNASIFSDKGSISPRSRSRHRRSSGNLDEATLIEKAEPLGKDVKAITNVESTNSPTLSQDKHSTKDKGKNWIKKKLSFLDTSKSEKSPPETKEHKTGSLKSRAARTRSSSTRRAETERRKIDSSTTSEESGDDLISKGREPRAKRRGKKGAQNQEEEAPKENKPRMKRYTRSKTDTSLEMKNLFSRFRQSQFSSKKPSVVKQFEKKLLENEIKALEDKNSDEAKGIMDSPKGKPIKYNENRNRYVPEAESLNKKEICSHSTVRTTASLVLSRTPSITSLQSTPLRVPPEVLPKPRYHTSMVDLRWPHDQILEESSGSPEVKQLASVCERSRGSQKPRKLSSEWNRTASSTNSRDMYTTTPTTDEGQSVSTLVGRFTNDKQPATGEGSFERGGPGRYSLNADRLRRFSNKMEGAGESQQKPVLKSKEPKRLSWVSGARDNEAKSVSWREKIIEAKSDESKDKVASVENAPTKAGAGVKVPGCRRLSEDMLKKKLALEKIFAEGVKGPRNRRYKRSVTQPISSRYSESESEDDSPSRNTEDFWETYKSIPEIKSNESQNKFEMIDTEPVVPSLTSRFKKPTVQKRRPVRWQKKGEGTGA